VSAVTLLFWVAVLLLVVSCRCMAVSASRVLCMAQ
jgi:hypothetical protein